MCFGGGRYRRTVTTSFVTRDGQGNVIGEHNSHEEENAEFGFNVVAVPNGAALEQAASKSKLGQPFGSGPRATVPPGLRQKALPAAEPKEEEAKDEDKMGGPITVTMSNDGKQYHVTPAFLG